MEKTTSHEAHLHNAYYTTTSTNQLQALSATELVPHIWQGMEIILILDNNKNRVLRNQRPFVKDTACLMFPMWMMVVSSLVEVGTVLALVHTRDLDWTVVMKENRVNCSAGESWSLIVLQSLVCDHHIIVNGQE